MAMRRIEIVDDMTPIEKKLIEKGMTRADLSRRSGVPVRTLENWANRSRTRMDVYQLYKVAQVLECHMEDLIEPEGEPEHGGK